MSAYNMVISCVAVGIALGGSGCNQSHPSDTTAKAGFERGEAGAAPQDFVLVAADGETYTGTASLGLNSGEMFASMSIILSAHSDRVWAAQISIPVADLAAKRSVDLKLQASPRQIPGTGFLNNQQTSRASLVTSKSGTMTLTFAPHLSVVGSVAAQPAEFSGKFSGVFSLECTVATQAVPPADGGLFAGVPTGPDGGVLPVFVDDPDFTTRFCSQFAWLR